MANTKISEYSSTPGNNTDIDGINIAEGCAPSGINNAIRELMAQLKDFQAGTAGDSFNGPIGTTTAAAGAFTTLAASGAVTLSGGTANGVPYLNGSKVLTSGSALQFDGSNLGLGVTPSVNSIAKTFELQSGFNMFGYANLGYINANAYFNGGWLYKNTAAAGRYEVGDAHKWYTAPSGTAGNAISFTQAMTLDASGNLLVGTTSRSNRLSVDASSGTTAVARFGNNTSSGNVSGIETSLESNGNNTSSYHFRGVTQGVNLWALLGNGTSTWSSDQRLKKNIETTRNGYIEDLCKLRVVKYNWHNHEDTAPKELGLIAQEVEQVFPGLIATTDVELNGFTNTKTIKGSVLPFMLLKAIQEQQAIIDAQQAALTALTARVAALESN